MFQSLRDAFRQAVRNFHTELNRDRVPEAADRLLLAMKQELADAHARTDELRDERHRLLRDGDREEAEARTCLRREEMARAIGDEETARVARDFAGRHLRIREIFSRKAEALQLELIERQHEIQEMEERLRSARLQRESLAATAGRTDAREGLESANDLFGEMDRMEERVRQMEGRADALQEMEEALHPDRNGGGSEPSGSEEVDLDRRLRELKARMQRERPRND